ncbi:replicative DNA helicase [Lacibacter cauensis]|uniref:Replicative DNA helicase n=1 Tax=Lacibacter cauensis TaxID=510947 RepID=A0A562SR39_9BACT|nr:replicative DNA helicase [Lacibacter cauensis]TWI83729.1 replicative DNA helicase [Lacibacter cauensis]
MAIPNLNTDRSKKKRTTVDQLTGSYSKVQPQARELEEAVLGAIMLEKSAFDIVSEILKPECFYVSAHQSIFKAMQELQSKSTPIDILTVVEQLKINGELEMVGGAYYVAKLTNSVVSTANVEAHSRIVLEKFIQRKLITISNETIAEAYEDAADIFDLLDDAESKLFEITNNYMRKNFESMEDILVKTIQRIEDMRNKQEDITGVPSGFPSMDKVIYGWQPSDLVILAARPAVGKTAFALNLVRYAALNKTKPTPVAFFSLEMSAAQLVQRILSAESEIMLEKISRGKLEDHEVQELYKKGIEPLAKAPIYIDDSAALNIFELRAKARRLVNKHGVGLLIIDYLQLMSGAGNKNTNREQEISTISRGLKQLAKELHIPIIALSQLSRDVEKRKDGNKMPQLSDLRESGAIEQDADMVLFLYRPEYYDITSNEFGESNRGETHVRIAKHRNGSLETIKLRGLLHIQKFIEDDFGDAGGMPGGGGSYNAPLPGGPGMLPGSGSWKQIPEDDGPKVYVQKGSKMNDMNFDEETPF